MFHCIWYTSSVHELPVTESILNIVTRFAREAKSTQVFRVHLRISELSHLRSDWLQRYFDRMAEGTIAEGALVVVESMAPVFRCRDCESEFSFSLKHAEDIRCPVCKSENCSLIGGDDYRVERIEVV